MNQNDKFNNILNECVDRILKGETVEQCLRSYPEQAKELEPLLLTVRAAKKAVDIQPRPEFRARARHEFEAVVRDMAMKKGQRQSFRSWSWQWRWQSGWAIALIVVIVVVLGGGSTVAAASSSMPDGALYSVKLASESVQLAVTPSELTRAVLNAKFANRRTDEIIYMASKGNAQQVQVLTQRLNTNLENLTNIAASEVGQNSGNVQNRPVKTAPGYSVSPAAQPSQANQGPVMGAGGAAAPATTTAAATVPAPLLSPPAPTTGAPARATAAPAATAAPTPAAAPNVTAAPPAPATTVPAPSIAVTVPANGPGESNEKDRNLPNASTSNNARMSQQDQLKQIITDNYNGRQARLEQALEKASPQVRPALRQAIAQSAAEYEKALKNLDQAQNAQ